MSRASLPLLAMLLTACPDPEPVEPEPAWQTVLQGLPGALLRVWGRSAKDVYGVGADGDGQGSLFVHYDGTSWRRIPTGTSGDLWWIEAVGPDDLRLVGEAGLVLRYRPSTGALERRQAPGDFTLYGAWGAAPDDVWYVGGDPARGQGVVYRDDGVTIREPPVALTATASLVLFKVHGFGADDVWIVGQGGLAVHWDGAAFTRRDTGTQNQLLTAHGVSPSELYAVGGFTDGVVLRWDGQTWASDAPPEAPAMNGVWSRGPGEVFVAGFNGRMFQKKDGAWSELLGSNNYDDLHSAWVDDQGGLWAAARQLAANPPKAGVLVHYGKPVSTGLSP